MMKDNLYQDGEFTQGIMGSNNPAMSIQNNSAEKEPSWGPARKKNFFERKRWLNYDVPKQPQSSAAQSENELEADE